MSVLFHPLVLQAAAFAQEAHQGQLRKDGDGVPYFEHPQMVARILAYFMPDDPALVAAAYLHDTLEDCPGVTYAKLESAFGEDVAQLVDALTNRYQEAGMDKQTWQVQHARTMSPRAQMLKVADQAANLNDFLALKPVYRAPMDYDFSWPLDRRLSYWEKAVAVAQAAAGACPPLDGYFKAVASLSRSGLDALKAVQFSGGRAAAMQQLFPLEPVVALSVDRVSA